VRSARASATLGPPAGDVLPVYARFIREPKRGDNEMRLKPKDRAEWQRWFAWHPVIINNVTVWLETVERKKDPDIFDWAYGYRIIDKTKDRKIPSRPAAKASR
jgi:hypothetical protein